jgi:dTDP-4-dehydrorhamnose reductase
MRVLVLGAGGMLGNAMFRVLNRRAGWRVSGTLRSEADRRFFPTALSRRLLAGVDVRHPDGLVRVFAETRPEVVVNCVGMIKQRAGAEDPLQAIALNAMLPHRLARWCALVGARLVHISTDCVFSGKKGGYRETDFPDAEDLYGRSKLLGEVAEAHTLTLRTSLIGHALKGRHGLVDWFLAQENRCSGYTRAVFSGLPTVELARVIRDVVLPRDGLSGVYHVAAAPISKYDLLCQVAGVYGKQIEIVSDGRLVIDRSLNAERFQAATGYVAPSWPELIESMHAFNKRIKHRDVQ